MNGEGRAPRPGPRWSVLLRGIVLGLPVLVTALHDLQFGVVLAVGLLPAVTMPLPPRRLARLRVALVGVLAAGSLVLGGLVALWPPAAVTGLFVLAVVLGRIAARTPRLVVGLYLCLPLTAVGFSFPGIRTTATLGGVMVLGSLWAAVVGLLWPADRSDAAGDRSAGAVSTTAPGHLRSRYRIRRTRNPRRPPAVPTPLAAFSVRVGLAGAICAAIGFAAHLDHVGWAPTAALLVMRPSPQVQSTRSWSRITDVVLGASVAIAVIMLEVPEALVAVLLLVVVAAATVTAGGRRYLTPMFTTFLVFLLLLADDPADSRARFVERVGETLLGVGVAALCGLLLPAVHARIGRRGPPSPAR